MSKFSTTSPEPFVSVIMPVRNEASFIERSLGAILGQSYPKDRLEIVIADGMSSDTTREVVKGIAAQSEIPIYIVDNKKRIAPAGLNRAIERTKGSIIVRVDGHCEIAPDYVENCVALLMSGTAVGVGGPIETIGHGLKSDAIALAMSSKFGVGGSAFRTVNDREMYADTVAFPAYTREIIRRAGPFDEELVRNQDDEYNYRIRELGEKILLSPKIRSRYYSRSTFRSLWRQYFQYGYWKVRVLQLHPWQMSPRQFVPFTFVTSLLLTTFLSLFWPTGWWLVAAILAGYCIANIVSALFTARGKYSMVPMVSVSFLILHLSYGIGSLVGLVSFAHRWFVRSGTLIPNSEYEPGGKSL